MGSTPSTDMKYTKEKLERAAQQARSVRQVCEIIGASTTSSSMQTHISKQLKKFEIDTSHFLGQGSNLGKIPKNRKSASEFLILLPEGSARTKGKILRRSLLEIGIPYKCESCDNPGIWRDKEILLEVDHINWNALDNRPENLRFLCPNCHSLRKLIKARAHGQGRGTGIAHAS